ncbi:hypothetical protein GGX14DRAFT_609339 [Mycena pura]|uniref:RGS domain-containing protein n=1 Tax=Mycena pura TaxID=153505 RepID=A0AAD6UPE8_9AGAR|nr:hypothetical protein GGX14DRAFT_609339 [Mycena pura]
MDDGNNNPAAACQPDALPMSPVAGPPENDESTIIPSTATTRVCPALGLKLTIRVPVENIPPTPPPSAKLPALPQMDLRRHSLTPVSSITLRRASAPVLSWSAANALAADRPHTFATPTLTATTNLFPAPPPQKPEPSMPIPAVPDAAPPPITMKIADGEAPSPKTILKATSYSAIHLVTKNAAQEERDARPQPGGTADGLPAPPAAPVVRALPQIRVRRKSAPARQAKRLDSPLPLRMRNSPSHVSHIDFESSDEDAGEAAAAEVEGNIALSERPPSIPEEEVAVAVDRDAARWGTEPDFVPARVPVAGSTTSAHRNGRRSHTRSSGHSRSSVAPSTRSEREGSTRRGVAATNGANLKHHALLGLSAMPTELVQRDVDYTLRALMSPATLARMLADPLARQRFRQFLMADGGASELDFWTDTQFIAQAMDELRSAGRAFRDLYVSGTGDAHVPLTPEARRELRAVLQQVLAADAGLSTTQSQLLDSMYNDQFQRYVKHQIIQEAHVALGRANLNAAGAHVGQGLGDTFVLTNPRLPDHPIVLASDGFVAVTGYLRSQIIGRNCRFLQGPGTPQASVQRIRDGLNSGKGCTELLLNYRRDGEPFYCLLCIIPVHDASGTIVYFIGGQTNVTGLLMTEKGLALGVQGTMADGALPPIQMSPALAELCGASVPADPAQRLRQGAAGAVAAADAGRGSPRLTGGGFLRGLFGRSNSTGAGVMRLDGNQVIAGAEALMNGPGERRFQDQYAIFQHTYNKVLIFRAKKREITFVSPQMLTYLGLSTRTQRELLAPPLLRSDMASLITAGDDRGETRRKREELKDAIRRGVPWSMHCGVKIPGRGILNRTDGRYKFGTMHMTPIKDTDNVAVAFVVIFG